MLIVSASFERYVCSISSTPVIAPRKRVVVIVAVVLLAVVMKVGYFKAAWLVSGFKCGIQSAPECIS